MTKSFIVTNEFYDAETGELIKVGSIIEADEEREELLRAADVIGKESAEPSDNDEWPKHVGGGTYELSNGERVKGKDTAEEAEDKLKAGDTDAKADNGANAGAGDAGGGKEAPQA